MHDSTRTSVSCETFQGLHLPQDRADRAACLRLWKLERAEPVSAKERILRIPAAFPGKADRGVFTRRRRRSHFR